METLDRLEVLAIDVGFSELQFVDGAHGGPEILRVNRGREAVLAVIRFDDRLVKIGDHRDRRDGAEDLGVHDLRALVAIRENRGLKKATAVLCISVSTSTHLSAFRDGAINHALDAL